MEKTFYDIITEANLVWNEFIRESGNTKVGGKISYVQHEPTSFYFRISQIKYGNLFGAGPWQVEFTPGFDQLPRYMATSSVRWDGVVEYFQRWVHLLSIELEAKEFLERIRAFQREFADNPSVAYEWDEELSQDEKEYLQNELGKLKAKLLSANYSEDQQLIILSKLDYLIERVDKGFSRVDWRNIFIATCVNLFTNGAIGLAQDQSFQEALKVLFHIVTGGRFLSQSDS